MLNTLDKPSQKLIAPCPNPHWFYMGQVIFITQKGKTDSTTDIGVERIEPYGKINKPKYFLC